MITKNNNKFFHVNGDLNDLGIYVAKLILNINNQFIDDEINAIAKGTNSTVADVYELYSAIHSAKKLKKCKNRTEKEYEVINLSQDEKDRLQQIASGTSQDTSKAQIVLACDGNLIVPGFAQMIAKDLGYSSDYVYYVLKHFKKSRMGYFKTKYTIEEVMALWDAECTMKEISEKLGITYHAVENVFRRLGLKTKKIDKRFIDRQKLSELCEQGLCRKEIAKEMGFHEDNIDLAMKRFGLKATRQERKVSKAKLEELCAKGKSVLEIAKEISVHKESVRRAIKKYGLAAMGEKPKKLEIPDEKIIELCKAGLSVAQIAKKVGCSLSSISRRLKKYGLTAEKRTPKYEDEKIIELYQAGLFSSRQIARKLGCCHQVVDKIFKRHGLKPKRARKALKYKDEKVIELCNAGLSRIEMAKEIGCSYRTIVNRLKRLGLKACDGRRKEKAKKSSGGKTFYHVTDPDNLVSILNEGLKSNENGEIFLFDNKKDDARIALLQCFLTDYALFEVRLFDENLEIDNVGERISGKQYFIKKELIPKGQLKFKDCYTIKLPDAPREIHVG